LTEDDVSFFRTVVGDMGLVTSSESLAGYNRDWMGKYNGASKLALRPQTTDQVSKILAYCNARVIAVVPQGGNTGLVGGSVPLFDEVILSLSRMDKIGKLDPVSGTLVCGAGCVLEKLNKHAEEHGFIMPLEFGAKGSCQIGGNVSTNAGGMRLLRYGSLRGSVLGVEAVLPSGAILDLCRSLRKVTPSDPSSDPRSKNP
jgi:FAD/FMN-containing dehydrogenase